MMDWKHHWSDIFVFVAPPPATTATLHTLYHHCGENATALFGITQVLTISLGLKRAVDVIGFHGKL